MARTAKTTETKTTTKKTTAPKTKAATTKPVKSAKPKTPKEKPTKVSEEKETKKIVKTYNVYYNGQDLNTHPQGKQPKQAARKAVSAIIMSYVDKKKDPKEMARINGYLDKKKKDENGNPAKTAKYKEELKKYEDSLSKEYMNKWYLFYLVQKSPRIKSRREYRHYYYGMRQSVNPDINYYLTKVDTNISEEEKKKFRKEQNKLPKEERKQLPKITIKEEEYKGKLIKDADGRVIEVQIPHYEMRDVLDKNGNPVLDEKGKKVRERVPNSNPRIISYKNNNVAFKLTKEYYDEHKSDFNLTPEQEEQLMNHFNHKRPPKIETSREIKARETKKRKREEKKAKAAAKKAQQKAREAAKKAEKKAKEAAKKANKKEAAKAAPKKAAVKKPVKKQPVKKDTKKNAKKTTKK